MVVIPRTIPSVAMADLTATLGGTKRDYEKVKLIERMLWPTIRKQYEKKAKK